MDQKKRQDLPASPGLWVVATPIGNLADMPARGREALMAADAVLCEDTRRTSQLLNSLGIHTKQHRFDAHATDADVRRWVLALEQGLSLALVSDAGTPAVSDPGARLVRAAHQAGVSVTPFPGPSAPVALLAAAGFEETAFTFRGFFPRKDGERVRELEMLEASEVSRVFIWFESPNRVSESLDRIAELQPDAELCVAKELTKVHERIFSGAALTVAEAVKAEIAREGQLGEWSFALRFVQPPKPPVSEWLKALQCLMDAGVSASEAAKRVSQHFGVARNDVYSAALGISAKNNDRGG